MVVKSIITLFKACEISIQQNATENAKKET